MAENSSCRIHGQWCEAHLSHAEDGDTQCLRAKKYAPPPKGSVKILEGGLTPRPKE